MVIVAILTGLSGISQSIYEFLVPEEEMNPVVFGLLDFLFILAYTSFETLWIRFLRVQVQLRAEKESTAKVLAAM